MKLKLYDADIDITPGRSAYQAVREHFALLPDAARKDFEEAYGKMVDCHEFAANGYDLGVQIILQAADVGVNYLIAEGFYDLTHKVFVNDYLLPYLRWNQAFEEWDGEYSRIIEEGAEMEQYRRSRLENRSRLVGGGFGVTGALKGIAMAGAGNAMWGLAHGLRNAVENANARASQKKQLDALFTDKQNKRFLAGKIHDDVFFVHIAVFDVLVEKNGLDKPDFLADPDKVERAVRIKSNVVAGRVPSEKVRGVIPEILEGTPYDWESYELALSLAGDADNELEAYGQCHGIDVRAIKRDRIERALAPVLEASPLVAADAGRILMEAAAELGWSQDQETQDLLMDIDILSRTFEDDVYATADAMRRAMQERDVLAAALDAIGEDVDAETRKLVELRSADYVYRKADAVLASFEQKVAALDLRQRKFDGHVYASRDEARQARADKKAIHAVYASGAKISKNLEQERAQLAALQAQTFAYRQAAEILQAYGEQIEAEALRRRTFDGQVYATPDEAREARERRAAEERARHAEAQAAAAVGPAAGRPASTVHDTAVHDTAPPVSRSIGAGMLLGFALVPMLAPLLTLRKGYTAGARAFAAVVFALSWYAAYSVSHGTTPAPAPNMALAPSPAPAPAVQQVALRAPAEPAAARADTAAPFVGKRLFNFAGGNGTQNAIVIGDDGHARVESLGTTGSSVEYEGPFSNPLPLHDGSTLLFKDGLVYLVKGDAVQSGCAEEGKPCVSELFNE